MEKTVVEPLIEPKYLPEDLRYPMREAYYSLFSRIVAERGLMLSRFKYGEVMIEEHQREWFFRRKNVLVAKINSDARYGQLDDRTNEYPLDRKYDGLEISLLDFKFEKQIGEIALMMATILNEKVLFCKKAN